jgi:hypothetical protein
MSKKFFRADVRILFPARVYSFNGKLSVAREKSKNS